MHEDPTHYYREIPSDTDVLITHEPPYEVLDEAGGFHYGSRILHTLLLKVTPRLHLFGHIHKAYGLHKAPEITFSNAALLNEQYNLHGEGFVHEI
ncbi:Calcineurin-like phosphoesterase [Capnocytophaga haemolytica]|jgi:ser/thr protein phosphatase family protein|uniref:Calcineurin-like phosphoesterase domain-containing protein n=1 Tax=Capnocytophaga haemolytica TaxID=45243 RepID=A0AAX2GVZ0_9FLAO|nr:metallophosphoesterase [Capnocytophaga haemolytica]SFO25416.1 Calcineurin-like phosphoesterase [Capnocytophaga haemolytica]SNV05544.1 Uncharacterised protein [Capnocytophaga haemolytica]